MNYLFNCITDHYGKIYFFSKYLNKEVIKMKELITACVLKLTSQLAATK